MCYAECLLTVVLVSCRAERARQKKELDLVLGERDILGTQLIRRNDELALLYEKVKIQQSTLSRGQIQYRDRCACHAVPLLVLL